MKAIERRIKKIEEALNVSDLPSYKEYINDFEGKYDDVDLDEILKREKIPFDIFVMHDLIHKDERIKLFTAKGELQ